MEWRSVIQQLERILQTNIAIESCSSEQWLQRVKQRDAADVKGETGPDRKAEFLLHDDGVQVRYLSVPAHKLSTAETRLIGLMLDINRSREDNPSAFVADEKQRANMIRDWFLRHRKSGAMSAELPEELAELFSHRGKQIPIWLNGDFPPFIEKGHYPELKKLLESFFDAPIWLIPIMEKEWLIMAEERLLLPENADEPEGEHAGGLEETLSELGLGLHGMLANEWLGDCHVAVHYPINPAQSLYAAMLELRETLKLGRLFHVGENVHLPWTLRLEKLIHSIPDGQKEAFLQNVFKGAEIMPETIATLEKYISLNCNVSETAKTLYIHRNTLLYRLDKFKQETGLDVRSFEDAALVKIALLLYKVTKKV